MKRKILLIVALAGCISLMTACSPQKETDTSGEQQMPEEDAGESQNEAYHKITAEQAKKMIDDGEVTIVDVRTKGEYTKKHIPDAILVPNETIGDMDPKALPDKDAVLLIYCRTGVRSKEAADKLVELGYQNVYDFGGIFDWTYETVEEREVRS